MRPNLSDFDVLLSFIKLHHVVNPVFVDCTTAESVAGLYARALKEGFHVVTPNKKANTRELAYYHELRRNAQASQHKFLYENQRRRWLTGYRKLTEFIGSG